jgi:hypothetical protein
VKFVRHDRGCCVVQWHGVADFSRNFRSRGRRLLVWNTCFAPSARRQLVRKLINRLWPSLDTLCVTLFGLRVKLSAPGVGLSRRYGKARGAGS